MTLPTPNPFPEFGTKEEQINWYENEIQKWNIDTNYVLPEPTAAVNGPLNPDGSVITSAAGNIAKEEIIGRLTASLNELRNS